MAPPPLLLPNMRTVQPTDLHIELNNGYRWLRFTAALANVGRGPIEVRPNNAGSCPKGTQHATQIIYRDVDGSRRYVRGTDTTIARRSAGCMVFHPAHHHWHFDNSARYTVWDPRKNEPVVSHPKTSFCLRDIRRVPAGWHAPKRYAKYYGACDRGTPQGISIGWADYYESYLPGQGMRLPRRLANGVYCLRVTVDPKDQLRETDDTDNRSVKSFTLRRNSISSGPPRPCRLPPLE